MDSVLLFSGDLFSMDIRSSSWYSLMCYISQWAALNCCIAFAFAKCLMSLDIFIRVSIHLVVSKHVYLFMYVCITVCAFICKDTYVVVEQVVVRKVETRGIFCYCFSQWIKLIWFTDIFITKRCISLCGKRSYKVETPIRMVSRL